MEPWGAPEVTRDVKQSSQMNWAQTERVLNCSHGSQAHGRWRPEKVIVVIIIIIIINVISVVVIVVVAL